MIQGENQGEKQEIKPKNNDKLIIILIIALAFLAIGFGVYRSLFNFDNNNNVKDNSNSNGNANNNDNINDDNNTNTGNNDNTNVTDNKGNLVVIILKDSSDGSSKTISVNPEGAFDNLPTLVKEDRTFDGWYTEEVGGTVVTTSTLYKTVNTTTLYAHWSAKKYKMTFILNNGSPNIVLEQEYGTKLEAPTNFGGDNLIFAGWNKDVPETVPAMDMSFYALWVGPLRTLSFDSNGGTPCSSTTIRSGGTYENLPVPTRDGYQFMGWYIDNDTFNYRVIDGASIGGNLTFDLTLYAKWVPNS
mgnify:CR=1 FL=1